MLKMAKYFEMEWYSSYNLYIKDIQLIGLHNLENIACAALVGVLSGASIESRSGRRSVHLKGWNIV
jgi:UDP-N-acetylmuramyl pentapeptide synthase